MKPVNLSSVDTAGIRLDHRPQLLPAEEAGGVEIACDHHEHLRGICSVVVASEKVTHPGGGHLTSRTWWFSQRVRALQQRDVDTGQGTRLPYRAPVVQRRGGNTAFRQA